MEFFLKNAGWITTVIVNLMGLIVLVVVKFTTLDYLVKVISELKDDLKELSKSFIAHGERLAAIEGRCSAKSKSRSKKC